MRRKISDTDGCRAIAQWEAAGPMEGDGAKNLALAVRYLLQEFESQHPGSSVEVRVPPFGAVQVIEGVHHTRGTPPAVIETSPDVWCRLATGKLAWSRAIEQGSIMASGERTDLSDKLPVLRCDHERLV